MAPPLHIALLSSPGMGHLIPVAELTRRLVARYGFTATILVFSTSNSSSQRSFLSSLPPEISTEMLPPVPALADLPPATSVETILSVECFHSIPAITDTLRSVNADVFVADLFGADAIASAAAAGVPAYLFFPSNLHLLSLLLHLPAIDRDLKCEFRELPEPVRLPGCVPIPGADILSPLQDRSRDCYPWMVRHGKNYRNAKAILVNTFVSVEPEAAAILRSPDGDRPPVFPIGPLIVDSTAAPPRAGACLQWLDRQPAKSVVFVCFGSAGVLTWKQMAELALGLELSGKRFLWAARSPSDGASDVSYFDQLSKEDPLRFLPPGFLERTRETGLVLPSWAPQAAVLAHPATGAFVTHCGWNSTLESIVSGVPMVAWPLYAEQRQNAVMLVDGIGAALRPEKDSDGVFGKEAVARVVVELMDGEKGKMVRRKVEELQAAAIAGLKDGGASAAALDEVVAMWTRAGDDKA